MVGQWHDQAHELPPCLSLPSFIDPQYNRHVSKCALSTYSMITLAWDVFHFLLIYFHPPFAHKHIAVRGAQWIL